LVVTVTHAGLAPLLVSLFVTVSFDGLVFPNATAVSLEGQEGALGSASALLGVGQFGTGALIAPLVGVAGSHDAVPMGVLIGVCGLAALAVNLVFSTPVRRRVVVPDRTGSPGPTDAERSEAHHPVVHASAPDECPGRG
jgi:MFS transporter, DHA1 family, multidrug resistance protein